MVSRRELIRSYLTEIVMMDEKWRNNYRRFVVTSFVSALIVYRVDPDLTRGVRVVFVLCCGNAAVVYLDRVSCFSRFK